MAEDSWRRPLVLGLCAAVPVALVTGWLVFGGSGDDPARPPAASKSAVAVVDTPSAEGDAPGAERDRVAGRNADRAGEGLASLAERQQELVDARADAQRRSERDRVAAVRGDRDRDRDWDQDDEGVLQPEDDEGYSPAEERSGPTPEEVEELQRLTALSMPSDAQLQALMENEPPMPSPEEIVVLRERTRGLLDFSDEELREVKALSDNAEPSAERLKELEDRRAAERAAAAEAP